MAQKINYLSVFFICALVVLFCSIATAPAMAAQTTSEFDFSATDDINKYDEYKKTDLVTEDGEIITYVKAPLLNPVNTANPGNDPINFYRYGAFLRGIDDVQRYIFKNLDFSSDNSTMCMNTLTIYADPEVEFELTNHYGKPIINSDGQYNSALVKYYNKSEENGNFVYFIELVHAEVGASDTMLTLRTGSTNVQPHYSFWYGAPLTRTATVAGNTFTTSVRSPNTSSLSVNVVSPSGIPKRAWVKTVTIRSLSISGNDKVTRASLNLTLPGGKNATTKSIYTSKDLVYEDFPSSTLSKDAIGTYKVQLNRVAWNMGLKVPATYQYRGQMFIEYLYAFGA